MELWRSTDGARAFSLPAPMVVLTGIAAIVVTAVGFVVTTTV